MANIDSLSFTLDTEIQGNCKKFPLFAVSDEFAQTSDFYISDINVSLDVDDITYTVDMMNRFTDVSFATLGTGCIIRARCIVAGSGIVTNLVSIRAAGSGYYVGALVYLDGGNDNCIVRVTSTGVNGEVTGVTLVNGGTGYANLADLDCIAYSVVFTGVFTTGSATVTSVDLDGLSLADSPTLIEVGTIIAIANASGYNCYRVQNLSPSTDELTLNEVVVMPALAGTTLTIYTLNIDFTILNSDLSQTTIPDDKYWLSLNITFEEISSGIETVKNVEIVIPYLCNAKCCIAKTIAAINACDCDTDYTSVLDALWLHTIIEQIEAALCCGKTDLYDAYIDRINKYCTDCEPCTSC